MKNITLRQLRLLSVLKASPKALHADIGSKMGITKVSAWQMCERAKKEGLVTSTPRRLTAKGRKVLENAPEDLRLLLALAS